MTALSGGKSSLELRLRAEQVDDSGKKETANATSLRTVLGYKTADYQGFTGLVEFENVSDFGQDDYNDGVTASALCADFSAVSRRYSSSNFRRKTASAMKRISAQAPGPSFGFSWMPSFFAW